MSSTRIEIRCKCARFIGAVAETARVTRVTCYCRDCQAYAHVLGRPDAVLDEIGGTDVVATLQQHVTLVRGVDALACLSLGEAGLLRWYVDCCTTPIANTGRNPKLSYVGLVHTCLGPSRRSLDATFGPASLPVHTKHARTPVRTAPFRTLASAARIFASVARARLDGSYARSPFFVAGRRAPVAEPRVLSTAERERAMNAV